MNNNLSAPTTSGLEPRIKLIEKVDLDPIKFKLMSTNDGPGWDRPKVDAIEVLYRQFLTLNLRYPDRPIVPSKEIDTFWHAHILDTMKYAEDCQNIFGYFLHHFPYFGVRDKQDEEDLKTAYQATKALFDREFKSKTLDNTNNSACVASCDAQQCSSAECNSKAIRRDRPKLLAA